jgi:hypothetical protein
MNLFLRSLIKGFIPTRLLIFLRSYRAKLKNKNDLKQRNLLQFEVHLADHCNLNCKSCYHFSPLVEENFMEINDFKCDCEKLGKLTNGRIKFIRFMGGEPLLHKQIIEFLDIGRENFPEGELIIVTNGILLPKQSETFWENCHKNNIEIQVSNYPIKIDRKKINILAKKHKVRVYYVGGKRKIIWRAMKLDISGQQNVKENFGLCSQSNICIHLKKGKLFTCPTTAYINYWNKFFDKNLLITKNDYIDIYKVVNINEILRFLSNPIPFCRYCNIKEEKNIEWGISKMKIQEWT